MNFTISGSEGSGELESVMVEMWSVSTPAKAPIELRKLSWNTRPVRKLRLGYWTVGVGQNFESGIFKCPSNTLHTLEVSCLGRNCHLAFQQDKEEPGLGRNRSTKSSYINLIAS